MHVCILAFITQHAKHIFSALALPYFPTFIKVTIFRNKNYWTQDVCFDLLYSFCLNISQYEKSSARYYHKYTYIFMPSTRHFCQILIKLQFSQQILKKNHHISWKYVRWEPRCSMQTQRWADKHDEVNSRLLEFCGMCPKIVYSHHCTKFHLTYELNILC